MSTANRRSRTGRAPGAGAIALALARTIAGNAPIAVRATKRAIQRGLDLQVRDAARLEAYAQAETVNTSDAREGIAALLAKRPPTFTGS